jgi:hypothetical protein
MVPADKDVAVWHFLGRVAAPAAPNAAHLCTACMRFALTV